jgi:hypothetical protein
MVEAVLEVVPGQVPLAPRGRPELKERLTGRQKLILVGTYPPLPMGWRRLQPTCARDGRFSFMPVGGRGPSDEKPAFDQQPIEAWAMAYACARAYSLTGEEKWDDALWRARSWFLGYNDGGIEMCDPVSGVASTASAPTALTGTRGRSPLLLLSPPCSTSPFSLRLPRT